MSILLQCTGLCHLPIRLGTDLICNRGCQSTVALLERWPVRIGYVKVICSVLELVGMEHLSMQRQCHTWSFKRDDSPPPTRVFPSELEPRWCGLFPLVGTSVNHRNCPKVSCVMSIKIYRLKHVAGPTSSRL